MSPSSEKGPEMRYLLVMYADRGYARPPDAAADYAALQEAMTAAGVYVTSGRLEPDDDSAVVRIDGDTVIVTEGGLATKGTAPGAFYLVDCETRDHAVDWAVCIPAAAYGSVEVRPLRAVSTPAGRR